MLPLKFIEGGSSGSRRKARRRRCSCWRRAAGRSTKEQQELMEQSTKKLQAGKLQFRFGAFVPSAGRALGGGGYSARAADSNHAARSVSDDISRLARPLCNSSVAPSVPRKRPPCARHRMRTTEMKEKTRYWVLISSACRECRSNSTRRRQFQTFLSLCDFTQWAGRAPQRSEGSAEREVGHGGPKNFERWNRREGGKRIREQPSTSICIRHRCMGSWSSVPSCRRVVLRFCAN